MSVVLATVTGTAFRNTAPTTAPQGLAGHWVTFKPILLDETDAIADSKHTQRVATDVDGAIPPTHLWPGAWRITLPDGEVIDGADHAGVVLAEATTYDLLTLRGYVAPPGVSVSTLPLPTPTAAGDVMTLDANLDPQWQPPAATLGAIPEPAVDGTPGQALLTDGAGTRYWGTVAGSGASDVTLVDNGDGTFTLSSDTSLTVPGDGTWTLTV